MKFHLLDKCYKIKYGITFQICVIKKFKILI